MGDIRKKKRASLKVDTENVPEEEDLDLLARTAPAATAAREFIGADVRKVQRVSSAPHSLAETASPMSAPAPARAATQPVRSVRPKSLKAPSGGDGQASDRAPSPSPSKDAPASDRPPSDRPPANGPADGTIESESPEPEPSDTGSVDASSGRPSPGKSGGESVNGGSLKKGKRSVSEPDLQELNGNVQRPPQRQSSTDLPPNRGRTPKIQWNNKIQVESLMVPTCPHHGQKYMEFKKGTSKTAAAVEFADIVDWVKESRALGARCTCTKCDPPREVGKIEKSQDFVIHKSSGEDGGLRDWSCFGCEIAVLSSW